MSIRRLEEYIRPNILIFILFFVGFLCGMLISFVSYQNDETIRLAWLDSAIMYLKYGEIQYADMLFYVVKKRIGMIFLLIVLCMSGKGQYFLLGGVALAGGFLGFFVSEFIICKGIMGSVLLFVSLFPHYICYIYAYYRLLTFLQKRSGIKTNINRTGQYGMDRLKENGPEIMKKMLPIAVVIIGIISECYVNPFFLKIFLKIFM